MLKAFEGMKRYRMVNLSLRTDCQPPYLDSGATPIGSAGRAPDRMKIRRKKALKEEIIVRLESVPGCKHPCPDSGATPIGSAGRAPDRTFSHSRIMPGDLILCRVTLFCHRQLTSKSWARYSLSLTRGKLIKEDKL